MFVVLSLAFMIGYSSKDDPAPPTAPRISMSVSLNQAATDLSNLPTGRYSVVEEDGTAGEVWALRVSDWLDDLLGVEATDYTYDFINSDEQSLLECLGGIVDQLPGYDDLEHAFFYDDSANENGLRILWDEQKSGCYYANLMDQGSVVSRPDWSVLERTDCSYVMEMGSPVPAHEGETVHVEGIATMGTDVMVSGQFVKFHIQDDTGGIYVFADKDATVELDGYDGSLFNDLNIYPGDRVAIKGIIGSHNGMVEFHPVSGYHVPVLERGVQMPAPVAFNSVDDIYDSAYTYVGDLVRVNRVELDPASVWPPYAERAKELEVKAAGDTETLYTTIYPGSGIPGSTPPEGSFDLVGCLHRQEDQQGVASYTLYPRELSDLNPLDDPNISGPELDVYKASLPAGVVTVPLAGLPQCLYDTGRTNRGQPVGPEAVVTLASLIPPEVALDPKDWTYKIIAIDGRQPAESLSFDQMKSGVLYGSGEGVNSYFYPDMDVSQIYYLNDLAEIVLYPAGGGLGPEPAQAEHGLGVNLIINDTNYAVDFEDLPDPDPEDTLSLVELIPNDIISLYTMDGFFETDHIRSQYDYRLVSYSGDQECTITWEEVQTGDVEVNGVATVVAPGGCEITDLFTIEMIRMLVVDDGTGEQILYWRDLPTVEIAGEGEETEEVVFFDDVLNILGLDQAEKVLCDYYLLGSDNFGTYFPYGHHHLEDMYFNPVTNEGFVTDEDMMDYKSRYSIKGIVRIEFRDVPQEAPSIFMDDALATGWLTDPENGDEDTGCDGCHAKKGAVLLPVNCADCHTMP
jgi:uncharacterized protein YdeI (BOF family)